MANKGYDSIVARTGQWQTDGKKILKINTLFVLKKSGSIGTRLIR
ncbi:MAG: hypothetical protein WD491_00220 [Balneolales bacterium]